MTVQYIYTHSHNVAARRLGTNRNRRKVRVIIKLWYYYAMVLSPRGHTIGPLYDVHDI